VNKSPHAFSEQSAVLFLRKVVGVYGPEMFFLMINKSSLSFILQKWEIV